jgi:hypothetical protein
VNYNPCCGFNEQVQRQLINFANQKGTITNSDLELAESVAQHEVIAQQVDVREATIHIFFDNMATMY